MSKPRVLIYLDNSNIHISTQRHSAKLKGFKDDIIDIHCRLKLDILAQIITKDREVIERKAFGFLENSDVAKMLKRMTWNIFPAEKSLINAKEKTADTRMTAEAVEDIILHKRNHENFNGLRDTVILLSGDQDMVPIIGKARKYGWDVEIWSYKDSLSKEIINEVNQTSGGTKIHILYLEQEFHKFATTSREEWYKEIPAERTLTVRIQNGGWINLEPEARTAILQIALEKAESIFHLPVAQKYTPLDSPDFECRLIVALKEFRKFGKRAYDFKVDVWEKRGEFKDVLENILQVKYASRNFRDMVVTSWCGEQLSDGQNILLSLQAIKTILPPLKSGQIDRTYSAAAAGRRTGMDPGNFHNSRAAHHAQPSTVKPKKTQMCVFARQGKCKFQAFECKFGHSIDEVHCPKCGSVGQHGTNSCPY